MAETVEPIFEVLGVYLNVRLGDTDISGGLGIVGDLLAREHVTVFRQSVCAVGIISDLDAFAGGSGQSVDTISAVIKLLSDIFGMQST